MFNIGGFYCHLLFPSILDDIPHPIYSTLPIFATGTV